MTWTSCSPSATAELLVGNDLCTYSVLKCLLSTRFNNGAIWRKLNNNQHCSTTASHVCVYCTKWQIDNAERLQFQSTNIVNFELNLFNKHVRNVRNYTVLHFQGDAAIHWYFCEETLATVVATMWQLHLLLLAESFCSGKPFSEALPNHRIPIIWCGACQY